VFPTSINGYIELKALKSEHVEMVTRGIKRQLETMKAVDISQQGNMVSFRGGFFPFRFIANLNALGPVNRGEIEVLSGPPAVVKYQLSTVGMLVDVSVIALAMAIFIGITRDMTTASLAFLIMFGVFFGMNYLVAVLRLSSFVKLTATVRGEGPRACPSCGTLYDPSDYRDDALKKRCATCQELLERKTSVGSLGRKDRIGRSADDDC
jgi:hypothetical protein